MIASGQRRLDEPAPSEMKSWRSTSRRTLWLGGIPAGGRSAAEHLIGALRCLYKRAEADGFIAASDNPASEVAKLRRFPSACRAVADTRLAEIDEVAASTGNDLARDTLLLWLHTETASRASRRGGALALPPVDLDPDQCLILPPERGRRYVAASGSDANEIHAEAC